ncbi:hypothetical protein CDAR_538301 [Caerostris darwini]|uniref:Uncharacterized protein n=1 Tax=Caerostris darwini TaxID=1538125 RepID=A0AAV4UCR9_9ARAC|nr:hypothetical protein CDAR_538301 [Caerostris darwini]
MKTTSILELGESTSSTAKTQVGRKIRHFQANSQILRGAFSFPSLAFVQMPIYSSISEPQSLSIRIQSSISTTLESISSISSAQVSISMSLYIPL